MSIGIKQGITYNSDCKNMSSIANPIIDNDSNMRYQGFFDVVGNDYDRDFDALGYGLKKTRANKGLILCDDASKLFGVSKGYVSMVLSLPDNIYKGIYHPLLSTTNINEYLLWGVNVGYENPSYPTIYAKLTIQGIEFTVWTNYGKFSIINDISTIYSDTNTTYEFIWSSVPIDDFSMTDFDATMLMRINKENIIVGNAPLNDMDLSGFNFCALDTPDNYYNLESTLVQLSIGNEVPIYLVDELLSSSSSSEELNLNFDDLSLDQMTENPAVVLVSYVNIGTPSITKQLQLTSNQRRFKHLWLPNSAGGNSLTKLNITNTYDPVEDGRYALCPVGVLADPSRTVVIPPGDCWIANRGQGVVTRVGLVEASHCRNTCLNTSTGSTALAYGADDAVMYYFDLQNEIMKLPSSTNYPSNSWGIRGLADDVNVNIWVESGYNSSRRGTWYQIIGDGGFNDSGSIQKYSNATPSCSYGAVCSYGNNYIWSVASYPDFGVVEWFSADDPLNKKGVFGFAKTYGISYSRGYIYIGDWVQVIPGVRRIIRIDERAVEDPNNFLLYTTIFTISGVPGTLLPRHYTVYTHDDSSIDSNRTEDLFINWYGTQSYLGTIRNHKQYANGENISLAWNDHEKYVSVVYGTGIGVMYDLDNNPYIWALSSNTSSVKSFNLDTNQFITFTSTGNTDFPAGNGGHYNYTNFTGTVDEYNVVPVYGTAIYIIDCGQNGSLWKKVCMVLDIPSGSELIISASASDDSSVFSKAIPITNCANISNLNFRGRYLRLLVEFSRVLQSDPSPTITSFSIELG